MFAFVHDKYTLPLFSSSLSNFLLCALSIIDLYGTLARFFLPALENDLGVYRRLFHKVTAALHLDRGDQSRPAPAERLDDEIAAFREDFDVRNQDLEWLCAEDQALA